MEWRTLSPDALGPGAAAHEEQRLPFGEPAWVWTLAGLSAEGALSDPFGQLHGGCSAVSSCLSVVRNDQGSGCLAWW